MLFVQILKIGFDCYVCFFFHFVIDRLFEEHKELLNLFTKFHKLTTRDEQASSEELAEHAVSVMTTLDESIRSLDNVDNFILYLHQVGQSHYKIPGFQKEYFWVNILLKNQRALYLNYIFLMLFIHLSLCAVTLNRKFAVLSWRPSR